MSKRRVVPALVLVLAAGAVRAEAGSALFYLELQAVAAYARRAEKIVYFSQSRLDAMQKPSLGFDALLRLSGRTADRGVVALQARLAYDADRPSRVELQVYNAYLKYKAGLADVWIGHDRPALGLSAALDSHAELLMPLAMRGVGFDRDWGVGLSRELSWGSAGLSLTTGSGMPLRLAGNYLAAARVSRGVLNRDNFALGASAAFGRTLDVMGTHILSSEARPFRCLSLDATYFWRRIENRVEAVTGTDRDASLFALFWRGSLRFLEEDRLRLEFQPTYLRRGAERGWEFATGATFQATAHLSLRVMAVRDGIGNDGRIVVQAYYYRAL